MARRDRASGTATRREDSACCAPRRVVTGRPEPLRSYARRFKALSHEARLAMLRLLAQAGRELCVCDIEAQFDLSQPTVSHHLRVLREAGLVSSERRGPWVYYALSPEAFGFLKEIQTVLKV